MEKGESALYFLFMAGCAAFGISALSELSLGTATSPGPGYVPLMVSIIGFVLSSILFIQSLRKVIANRTMSVGAYFHSLFQNKEAVTKIMKVVSFIAVTVVYLLLFTKVSFYLETLVYMFILGKLFGMKGWLKPLILGVGFVVAAYLIFVVAFDMHL